jgi:hypothetical protein
MRVRNLADGGAVNVPITVSAVSEKPVVALLAFVGPGLAAAEATATVAKARRPAHTLIIGAG